MQSIPWYKSKIIWLGILTTLAGILPLVGSLLAQTTIAPADFAALVSGILTVIMRAWFLQGPIQ